MKIFGKSTKKSHKKDETINIFVSRSKLNKVQTYNNKIHLPIQDLRIVAKMRCLLSSSSSVNDR